MLNDKGLVGMFDSLAFLIIIGMACAMIISTSSSIPDSHDTGSEEVIDVLLGWEVPSPSNCSLVIPLSERLVWEMGNGGLTEETRTLMIQGAGYLTGRPDAWQIIVTGPGTEAVIGDELGPEVDVLITHRDLGAGVNLSYCVWSIN